MKLRHLAVAAATYVPGFNGWYFKSAGGATNGASARYCYCVWLRHLCAASKYVRQDFPATIAELGPGDSLGVGIAALLSGAQRYYAFDYMSYANNRRNLEIFDELVELFRQRAVIPDEAEFPLVVPRLDSYEFPRDVLTEKRLRASLEPRRVSRIRAALAGDDKVDPFIAYRVPWTNHDGMPVGSVDMILSQAVLEHVDQLEQAYAAMRAWIAPNGVMTHTIDYKSHGLADQWSGHWRYSDFQWKLLCGRKPYVINRQPHSVHLNMLQRNGFEVICSTAYSAIPQVQLDEVAPRFKQSLTTNDLGTAEAFIVARPRASRTKTIPAECGLL
jgi:hypothetical protein